MGGWWKIMGGHADEQKPKKKMIAAKKKLRLERRAQKNVKGLEENVYSSPGTSTSKSPV
jgi:hypothetical protein